MEKVVTFPESSGRVTNYLYYRQTPRIGSYSGNFIYSFIRLKYLLSAFYVPGLNKQIKLEEGR